MEQPVVYDKAKYHRETVELAGLDDVQAEVHTAFFLGWLIDNDLLDPEFVDESGDLLTRYRAREVMATDVYGYWDCCLVDDMLNPTGNAFAQHYFDLQSGRYIDDYIRLLASDLPSEFHVVNTWENYEAIRKCIDERFAEWNSGRGRSGRPWWRFW